HRTRSPNRRSTGPTRLGAVRVGQRRKVLAVANQCETVRPGTPAVLDGLWRSRGTGPRERGRRPLLLGSRQARLQFTAGALSARTLVDRDETQGGRRSVPGTHSKAGRIHRAGPTQPFSRV